MSEQGQKIQQNSDFRNWRFRWAGHILAIFMCLLFVGMFGRAIYQRDGWRSYFFKDTLPLKDACAVAVEPISLEAFPQNKSDPSFRPLTVPHQANDLFADAGNGQPLQAHYRCKVSHTDLSRKTGLIYLHVGWVFGDRAIIYVNGNERASFNGNDKPAIPITLADSSSSTLLVDLFVLNLKAAPFGLVGNQPMVIAFGSAVNARIFGIETALQTTGNLYHLLPVLTLGLVLVFGWFYGVRLRLMLSAFFFFGLTAVRTIIALNADQWPWGIEQSYIIQTPFNIAASAAFLILGMELLSIARRLIYPCMIGVLVAIPVLLFYLLSVENSAELVNSFVFAYRIGCVLGALGLVISGGLTIQLTRMEAGRLSICLAFLCFAAVFGLAVALDLLFAKLGIYIRLAPNIDIAMPVFIGGVLFFTLANIEKNYQKERVFSQSLTERLELGRAVQRLLLPKELRGSFAEYKFQSFYKPSQQMSGDWLNHWRLSNGEYRLLIGDVAGKGPQAALAAAVISTIVNDCKKREVSMEECIRSINSGLLELFGQHTSTTVSAITLKPGGRVGLYNCGNAGWVRHSSAMTHHYRLRGSLLGVSESVTIGYQEITLKDGEILFAYTDGVCDGPRALRRLLMSLNEKNFEIDELEMIFKQAQSAGRDNNFDDDQSMIVIKAA